MPSKEKKAKGKARKAAKSRKDLSSDNVANEVKQDDDALLEEAINLAAAEREELEAAAKIDEENNVERCDHGFVPWPKGHVCTGFVRAFVREFSGSNRVSLIQRFAEVNDATITKYAAVWHDPTMLEYVATYYLAEGTGAILEEKDDIARQSAKFAICFETWRDIMTGNNSDVIRKWGKVEELSSDTCDEHTLVSFFRKRIPCKCLDKRYKEVKSIVKMGHCNNPDCPLPDRKVEASKLMHCEQCTAVFYCSIECQKAAWPKHKEHCVKITNLRGNAGIPC